MTDLPASLMDLTPALLEELRMQVGVERIARRGTLSVATDDAISYACPVATLALVAGIIDTLTDDGEDYDLTAVKLYWCTNYLSRSAPVLSAQGFSVFIDGWDHPELPFADSMWGCQQIPNDARQASFEHAQGLGRAYFAAYPEHALDALKP